MRLTTATALSLLLLASPVLAGDLNPPGAPAPTMVDLDDLNAAISAADASAQAAQDARIDINSLPGTGSSIHEITASGSYYLSANVTGQSGKSGILVSANFVTIDLNGFTVVGVPGATVGIDLSTGATRDGVTIRNGNVRSWPGSGIAASGAAIVRGTTVENVACSLNGSIGASLGSGAKAANCLFHQNGSIGLVLGGIARDCVATSNTGNGIQVTGTAANCLAQSNGGSGIAVNSGTAEGCKSNGNTGNGFDLQTSVARGCVADSNGNSGISAGNRSVVVDSTCSLNGTASLTGAGIAAGGGNNIVRGNNVSLNDIGVQCPTSGNNLVVGNHASGNGTNFSVAGGNLLGTVLTTEAAMNAAANDYANFAF